MKTNTTEYKALIQRHILGGICDYAGPDCDKERARHIWAMFDATHNYPDNLKRYPNTQERVADWLVGLPLNIACYNGDIIDLYEHWHGETLTDEKAERVVSNWFSHVAFHLLGLWRDAGINPHKVGAQGCVAHYAVSA